MVSEQPERFFVSEIIREAIFLQYKQEIPYACQVQITNFVERPGAKDEIEVRARWRARVCACVCVCVCVRVCTLCVLTQQRVVVCAA
jgi:hypothetical protein